MAKQKPMRAEQFTEHERTSYLYRTVEEMRKINDAVERRYCTTIKPDGMYESGVDTGDD